MRGGGAEGEGETETDSIVEWAAPVGTFAVNKADQDWRCFRVIAKQSIPCNDERAW